MTDDVPSQELENRLKLALQFPKYHKCTREMGERYITKAEWVKMQWRYNMSDEYADCEGRDCPFCLSTLVVMTKINDASKE